MFNSNKQEWLCVLLAIILLLAGCSAKEKVQENTSTQTVKIFESIPSLRDIYELDKGDEWRTVTLSIFNQKAQTISFDYVMPVTSDNWKFSIKNGQDIFMASSGDAQGAQSSKDSTLIFSIWKTAPFSNEEFIKALTTSEGANDTDCMVYPKGENTWQIVPKKIYKKKVEYNGWSGAWPLSSMPTSSDPALAKEITICGTLAFMEGYDWNIRLSNGFAVASMSMLVTFIDLASITYENKG